MNMQKIRLQTTSQEILDDSGETYIGYGFTAHDEDADELLFSVDDLSGDENDVTGLIELIRSNDVYPCHYMDVVADFLSCPDGKVVVATAPS